MAQISPEIFALLLPARTRNEYDVNIETLREGWHLDELRIKKWHWSHDELFDSSENIPRSLELFLIIDFEQKRTLICDFLFAIHKDASMNFSLEKYLYATKRIFSIITQYRWAREDLSFILKIIFIYLGTHMKEMEKEKIFHILEQFQIYGPWKKEELESFFYDNSCVKIFLDSMPKSEGRISELINRSNLLKKIISKFWK